MIALRVAFKNTAAILLEARPSAASGRTICDRSSPLIDFQSGLVNILVALVIVCFINPLLDLSDFSGG